MDRPAALALARAMCAQNSLGLGEYSPWPDHPHDGFLVAGFGAGIVMALADHLDRHYSGMPILTADLPGRLPFENRCQLIDYLTSVFPTVLLLWSSLRSLDDYLYFLEQRGWRPPCTWIYLRGLGEENLCGWTNCGVRVLESAWQDAPLGNLTPRQIIHPWELLAAEMSHVPPGQIP